MPNAIETEPAVSEVFRSDEFAERFTQWQRASLARTNADSVLWGAIEDRWTNSDMSESDRAQTIEIINDMTPEEYVKSFYYGYDGDTLVDVFRDRETKEHLLAAEKTSLIGYSGLSGANQFEIYGLRRHLHPDERDDISKSTTLASVAKTASNLAALDEFIRNHPGEKFTNIDAGVAWFTAGRFGKGGLTIGEEHGHIPIEGRMYTATGLSGLSADPSIYSETDYKVRAQDIDEELTVLEPNEALSIPTWDKFRRVWVLGEFPAGPPYVERPTDVEWYTSNINKIRGLGRLVTDQTQLDD